MSGEVLVPLTRGYFARVDEADAPLKGVYKTIGRSRWHSTIKHEGRTRYVGTFSDELLAAIARDEAALAYHGEFAWLNRDHFPELQGKPVYRATGEVRPSRQPDSVTGARR